VIEPGGLKRRQWQGLIALLMLSLLSENAAFAADCPPLMKADWPTSAPALAMPVMPGHCESVDQSPPQFAWPDQGETRYQLELRDAQNRVTRHVAERNWLLLDKPLPQGSYQWRVKPINASGKGFSEWRQFNIAADAVPFAVASARELLATAITKPRPRAFPMGEDRDRYIQNLLKQRRLSWNAFLANARQQRLQPHSLAPDTLAVAGVNQKIYSTQLGDNKKQAGTEVKRMLDSALAWMVTRDSIWLTDAKQSLILMSQWDPRGSTGINNHQVAGRMVWSMALGLDWLYSELTPNERKQIVDVLAVRMDGLISEFGIYPRRKLDKMPFNSHAWVAIGELAAASSLLAGEDARAVAWFDATVRPFIFLYSPWGGMDGGLGNGTAYGIWDALALTVPLDILRMTVGVDMFQKGWNRNLGRFLTYFLPPGSPEGVFGDGAERDYLVGDAGNLSGAHASRLSDPVIHWYSDQVPGRRPNEFVQLFPGTVYTTEKIGIKGMPKSAHFKSIGWSAMHSSLEDKNRVSVYFKSSSYGSFNHSHADQNSFVLHANGRPLLIDSGFYDFYGSAHGAGWYRQTQAHNAITFDGGQGQALQTLLDSSGSTGKILDFFHSEKMDYVTGDSTPAFKAVLSQSLRSLVYLRPNFLVVYDVVAAHVARKWEWNLHALDSFKQEKTGQVSLEVDGVKLCIDMQSTTPFGFTQTDQFAVGPEFRKSGEAVMQKQWHGRFGNLEPSREATFIAVLSVGCEKSPPLITPLGNRSYSVKHGDVSVLLTPKGVVRDVQ
jgi:hypothetical protein